MLGQSPRFMGAKDHSKTRPEPNTLKQEISFVARKVIQAGCAKAGAFLAAALPRHSTYKNAVHPTQVNGIGGTA
jgi:hypothetical protein